MPSKSCVRRVGVALKPRRRRRSPVADCLGVSPAMDGFFLSPGATKPYQVPCAQACTFSMNFRPPSGLRGTRPPYCSPFRNNLPLDVPLRPNWDASPRGAPYVCGEHAGDADARSCVLDAREGVATREVPKGVGRARVKAASSWPSRVRSAAPGPGPRALSRPPDGQMIGRQNDT